MWYIFRHGETFCNRNKIKQGLMKNSFLTLNGIFQAHINGLKLKKLDDDFTDYKFLCSPLERTYHTCKLIMNCVGREDEPIVEDSILSRSRGRIEKYHEDEIKKNFPKEWEKIQQNIWGYRFEEYESYKDLYVRLAKFIKKYENEENVVIVAHKGLNRNLMYLLQKNIEVNDLLAWINNLSDEEGNFIIKDLKDKVKSFDQNYFFSWNKKEFVRI